MTLISVYIPETAGADFGERLKVHYGERICLHYYHPYGYDPFTSSLVRLDEIPANIECIHGHFPARRFLDKYPDPMLVTWLRDPVERVISEYEYLKANPDPQSGLSQLIEGGAGLLEFAEHDYARNTQARYVDGVPLSDFAFVGVSERLGEELARFAGLAGIALLDEDGADPGGRWRRPQPVGDAARGRIHELNLEDSALYEAAEATRVRYRPRGVPAAASPAPSERGAGAAPTLLEPSYVDRYLAHIARLRETVSGDGALESAVGGEFIAIGRLEFELLRSLGLKAGGTVVDVGCGSGRLALPLSALPGVSYIGTDVVPDLLEHARRITARPDWRFELTKGLSIPCGDDSADFACFFSVLTHLTHEDSFRYLREARRVLKPGGRIVLSFLEFHRRAHWVTFQRYVDARAPGDPINQFIERDAIRAWASHLALRVDAFFDGDRPHIPIDGEIRWQNGIVMTKLGNLGQSVAILSKP